METHFPLEFTLESGTHVIVDQTGENKFDFTLKPGEGPSSHFTYIQDDRSKTEVEESLEFEQIDALRRFWLETEDIV